MGEITTLVKCYVAGLQPDQLFTTRDCLVFGSRTAVDQVLSRLVKSKVLVRLTRGVFTRNSLNQPKPSPYEVARIKASSFGRHIVAGDSMVLQEPEQEAQPNKKIVFLTNSSSSTFKYDDITIYLKQACWRKMSLQESKVANQAAG